MMFISPSSEPSSLEETEKNMENLPFSETKIGSPPEESSVQIGGTINEREPVGSFLGLIVEYLSKQPQPLLISVGSVMVLLVGILNHIAGPELSSTVFYLIPITLVTWFTKRSIGLIISILSALTWRIVDLMSGAAYSSPDIPFWNGVVTLSSFFMFTFILSALKSILKQEKELSRIDFLTGVQNRRCFIELVNMEIIRARRYEHPFTVACIDLDNFKTVNDCFGHRTGDMLLHSVARSIQENVRGTDTVARLGGDEFAILLPETGRNVAETIMRRVRNINLNIMQRHEWPVTLSIGVVTFKNPPSTADETLRISDQLMYKVKNSGKNSIKYKVFRIGKSPAMTEA